MPCEDSESFGNGPLGDYKRTAIVRHSASNVRDLQNKTYRKPSDHREGVIRNGASSDTLLSVIGAPWGQTVKQVRTVRGWSKSAGRFSLAMESAYQGYAGLNKCR